MESNDKLRYSRQIVAYGKEMQEKLMKMKYLIYGCRGLGVEVAKHLILNGVDTVHLYDPTKAELRDLASNYFITPEQVADEMSRASASLEKLQILNNHVKVNVIEEFTPELIFKNEYNGVIITEAYGLDWSKTGTADNDIYNLNYKLREKNVGFIITECMGKQMAYFRI